MTKPLTALAISLMTTLPFVGCASSNEPNAGAGNADGADQDDLDGKADGVTKPTGSYVLSKPSSTGAKNLTLLALKIDKTYHAESQVECVTEPCDPLEFDGSYKFTKSSSSSKRYLKFDDGTRYEYKLASSGKLSLRLANTTPWFEMSRATQAWCSQPSDCTLQNLPQPKCPGQWQCNANACSFSECSGGNDCEAAGGSCVALTPTSCKTGVVGDANEYSCGGGVGVQCCLPPPEPPTCEHVGTNDEGWYFADGTKICAADCGGITPTCSATGSKSEGWYTTFGHGCGGGELVGWDNCG